MAKNIKAIKCPNCGSVSKTEIKLDFYRCTSCQTEYFLDNDDVNVNYNHNYKTPINAKTLKIIGIAAASIIGFFILISIITSLFSSSKPSNYNAYSAPASREVEKEEDQGYSANRNPMLPILQDGKPVMMTLEDRRYKSNTNESKNGAYLTFYDPLTKKMLSEELLSKKEHSNSDFKFKTFSDDNIYIINDKSVLLKVDKQTLKTEDVGKKLFGNNDELAIGVATMEFERDDYGDGLIILTNDGKKLHFYPLVQKVYTEKGLYKVNGGFNTLLPGAKEKSVFRFSSESTDYPEEKLQLIRITYKDNGGGPKDFPSNIFWSRDYGRSGIFNGTEPHTKELINPYQKSRGRVSGWKDITPGRLYFSPSVVLDDGNTLVIQFRVDANKKSDFKFQQINRQTGAVEGTAALKDGDRLKSLITYKDGFLGSTSDRMFMILDQKGIVKSEYKLD